GRRQPPSPDPQRPRRRARRGSTSCTCGHCRTGRARCVRSRPAAWAVPYRPALTPRPLALRDGDTHAAEVSMISRSVPVWLALTAACAAAAAPRAAPKPPGAAAAAPAMPSIADKVAGARAMPGLFNLYWDERAGKLWLEIGQWQQEFLYQSA